MPLLCIQRVYATIQDSRHRTHDSGLSTRDSQLTTQAGDFGFPLAFCAHKIDLNFYCDKKLLEKRKETRAQSAQTTRGLERCGVGQAVHGRGQRLVSAVDAAGKIVLWHSIFLPRPHPNNTLMMHPRSTRRIYLYGKGILMFNRAGTHFSQ